MGVYLVYQIHGTFADAAHALHEAVRAGDEDRALKIWAVYGDGDTRERTLPDFWWEHDGEREVSSWWRYNADRIIVSAYTHGFNEAENEREARAVMHKAQRRWGGVWAWAWEY